MDAIITLFIELTNQIFWEGYAEQLSASDPKKFKRELADFTDSIQ
nr:hypothetical protein [Mucilaginibacter sp. Bleaf8]